MLFHSLQSDMEVFSVSRSAFGRVQRGAFSVFGEIDFTLQENSMGYVEQDAFKVRT